MATKTAAPARGNQAPPPGAYARVPGIGARPRRVIETGPCQPLTAITLQQSAQVTAPFLKFQTLDIDRAFLLELDMSVTFTQSSNTIAATQGAPGTLVNLLQVNFESAYATLRLPGFLAQAMQQYRSVFAPKNPGSAGLQAGFAPYPVASQYGNGGGGAPSAWLPANPLKTTPGLTYNVTGTANVFTEYFEVPVSMVFDLYYELNAQGKPIGRPIPRCNVSPQFMAATTRNVTPAVTFNQLLVTNPGTPGLALPTAAAVQSTSAGSASGTATATWWRDAWVPTTSRVTEPAARMWQYSRDYIAYNPSGAQIPVVPIDDTVPGQGQILSMIVCTWDPALNSFAGGFTPYTAYQYIELLYGSNVQIFQDTPASNQYNWLMQHDSVLPVNMMGWDLALTEDGKLTNERALNTLVQAGTQVRVTYNTGTIPSNNSTIFVGLEMLKKVGS